MTRYITANGEAVKIIEETRDGDRHLVAKNVPIVKPMDLNTGYVPEASIEQSTGIENTHGTTGWSGTTPTVNHPRNHPSFSWHDPARPSDDVVLAANEDVQETLGVGDVENDHFDGEYVRADIAVNADRAEEMGGEAADIVDALESDGPLEVSSQYLHAELPPGEYDGEYRDDPKAIAAPDSVALIPNGKGVCSIDDGCGIAPGVTANVADYADVVGNTAIAGTDDPGNAGEGQRTMGTGSQMAGVRQLLGSLSSLLGSAAGPTTDRTTKSQTAETPDADPRGGDDSDGESESDESAESDTDSNTTANTSMKDNKREELIRFITANSDLNEDSLEHMGDTCLENTHEMVVANASDDGSDGSDADGGDDDGTDDDDDPGADDGNGDADDTNGDADGLDAVMNRLDDLESRMVTEDSIDQHVEATANQLEKEERAERIVANSAEYGEGDADWIADLPEKELDRKENAINASGGLPASSGGSIPATGNADGDVDTDDMPDLEVY
ncbi:hypothetical protein [Halostagnicola sp. A-GB9-2]|uniref:hypothetical protein n=1 Tax=Halostagnicola sp. A-GB9-2 TaxID=3048066 RepID=UPI0024BF8D4F|nr:hypothetical protein [Halostagnicola sp. A-GB9-2]MDJ1434782.1 hypothetical protein [Halostagnicola sp. A-GB9-2]